MIGADTAILIVFLLGNETFAALTIPTVIISGVNMWFKLFPNFLTAPNMISISRTNDISIGNIEFFDKILEFLRILSGVCFNTETVLLRGAVDFIAMFIGANLKPHLVALAAAIPSVSIR